MQLGDRCCYRHGLGVSCASVTGSVIGLAVFWGGGVLDIIFKETCLTIYVRMYVYVMLLFYV